MTSYEGDPSGRPPQDMPTLDGALLEGSPQSRLLKYRSLDQLRQELGQFPLSPHNLFSLMACEVAGWNAGNVFPLVLDDASKEQKTFAAAFFDFQESSLSQLADRESSRAATGVVTDNIHAVVNGETEDTVAWWVFAPYVYQELLFKGVSSQEAMQRLLLWARDGSLNDPSVVHLSGLDFLRERYMYRLSKNPQGESHRLTRLKAAGIADILLTKEEFDPEKIFR